MFVFSDAQVPAAAAVEGAYDFAQGQFFVLTWLLVLLLLHHLPICFSLVVIRRKVMYILFILI